MKSKGLIIALSIIGGIFLIAIIMVMWGVGAYNRLVALNEGVNSAWSQVQNQYQRRFDLIPNLVETVKGYATHEKETLENVVEARAKVGQMVITPEVLKDPQAFQMFEKSQGELTAALSRLMAVSENYPNLKANENFLQLQQQLEGTENRIAVERRHFNEVVQSYNTTIRTIPTSLIAGFGGFGPKAYFQAQTGAESAPKVKF
ncbi:MAG TPA: LemA family protein [Bacteroidota bacterium]|nr:LemA family protein [Bacteroidota bacterium]